MRIKHKNHKVIKYNPNRGKGRAIRVGIDNASGDIMAQVDADSQFPPEEIPGLVQPIYDGEVEITFCSRFCKGASVEKSSLTKMRRIANFVVSTFASILAGRIRPSRWLTDVNAGFKGWTKKAIKRIDIRCPHFGYEPEIAIMASKKGYKIKEIPVNYKVRDMGNTNVNLIREGIIIPLFLIKTKLFRK